MDPQPRTLRLATPHLHGPDVAEVQRMLGVEPDGIYGIVTAGAVVDWKRARGDPRPTTYLTPAGRRRLLHDVLLRAVRTMEGWAAAAFLAAPAAGGETASLGLRDSTFNPLYAPAVLAEARAGDSGLRMVGLGDAFRGDLVLFDWNFKRGDPTDHLARLVRAPANGRVRTVDGNSGGDGLMALRERPIGSVRAFVRDS